MEVGPVQNNQPMQQPLKSSKPQPMADVAKGEVSDHVEISENARRMLAEMADQALLEEATPPGGITPTVDEAATAEVETSAEDHPDDKLAEIRQRIESGYYDKPEIIDRIADRLSDDLDL